MKKLLLTTITLTAIGVAVKEILKIKGELFDLKNVLVTIQRHK